MAACTDTHYGSPEIVAIAFDGGPPPTIWLNAFPNPIAVRWEESTHDCIGETQLCSGGTPHAFKITSTKCDGCELLVETPAGFRPFASGDDASALYARPAVIGGIDLTLDLESSDGITATATLHMTGDRITAMAASCDVYTPEDEILGACDVLASRPSNSVVGVSLSVTTTTAESLSGFRVFPSDAALEPYLPKVEPDAVATFGGGFELTGSSATSETVTWDGIAAPIAVAIPPTR
jgi:hypothetical protein